MAAVLEKLVEDCEEVRRWISQEPITFDEFLDMYMGRDDNVELVDGAVVERKMVQYDHEKLLVWLLCVAGTYASKLGLGEVLGSRTAVKIAGFRGRLPDLIFVRAERLHIIQQKALYEAPDLMLEIRSPGNRKSHMIALEIDYRNIGAQEIVIIDPRDRRVRVIRKLGDEYAVIELTTGFLEFETIPGIKLEVNWLFDESRPDAFDTVSALLADRRE